MPLTALRVAAISLAACCAFGSIGCGGAPGDEGEDDVAADEQALVVADLSVAGECVDRGAGPRNVITKVTPVTFRVQVYKTLVRVWVPEVSPGVEFAPLGGVFHGRDEYRPGNGPPSNPGIRTVSYRYWKLPHATAANPVVELALEHGEGLKYPGIVRGANEYQMVIQYDAATGNESLGITMHAEDRYREWGGQTTDTRFPFVTCYGHVDKLTP